MNGLRDFLPYVPLLVFVVFPLWGWLFRLQLVRQKDMDDALNQGEGRAAALAVLEGREIGRRDAEHARHFGERDAALLPQFPDAPTERRHGPASRARRRRT